MHGTYADDMGRQPGYLCHAGQSRYVAGVARYLVESRGMTRRAALERISAKREIDLAEDIDGVLGA